MVFSREPFLDWYMQNQPIRAASPPKFLFDLVGE